MHLNNRLLMGLVFLSLVFLVSASVFADAPTLDTTPPVVSVPGSIVQEATSSFGAIVSFEASATDDVDGSIGVSCSPVSGSMFAFGTTVVTCSATDSAGNTGTNSFSVTVQDTTNPSAGIVSPLSGSSVKGTIIVNVSASDSGSGIASVEFWHSSPVGMLFFNDTTAPYFATLDTTSMTDGTHNLWVKAYDYAGNVLTSSYVSVGVDNVAPSVTITAPASGTLTNDNRVSSLNFMASDNLDGLIDYTIYVDGVLDATGSIVNGAGMGTSLTAQGDGIHNVSIVVQDDAGNTNTDSIRVTIDATAPTIGSVQNNNIWFNESFNFILGGVSWDISGKNYSIYRIGSGNWTEFAESIRSTRVVDGDYWYYALIDQEGSNILEYKLVDNAGNIATNNVTVKLDLSAPVTTATARLSDASVYDGNWTNQSVSVTLGCDDSGLSGCGVVYYKMDAGEWGVYSDFRPTSDGPLISFSTPGHHYLYYYSIDNVGNAENVKLLDVFIVAVSTIGGEFEFPDGSTPDNATNVTVHGDFTFNINSGNGTSSVTLLDGTVITGASGSLNLSALSASNVSLENLTGLGSGVVVDGAIQWGIVDFGLVFSKPITVKVYLGPSYEGQTLDVRRSTSGSSGWTQDGIEDPKKCTVTLGICEFNATKASYYATTTTTSTSSGTTTSTTTTSGGNSFAPKNTTQNASVAPVVKGSKPSAGGNAAASDETAQPRLSGITGAVVGALGKTSTWAIIIVLVIIVVGLIVTRKGRRSSKKKKNNKKDI